MRSWKSVTSSGLALVLAGVLSLPVIAQQVNSNPPAGPQQQGPPAAGTLNYVEGQASVAGQAITEKSVGSVQLQAGQTLATQKGRTEVLLTPGVIARLDNDSAVVMENPGIPDTQIAVQSGRAMVEADQVLDANHIEVREGPATVRIVKPGLYDFDAAHGLVRVYDGRAEVTVAGSTHTLQGGHQMNLMAPKLQAKGFDKKANEDGFYRWGSLRSSYLAEANADAARGFSQGYYGPGYAASGYAPYLGYAAYDPGWFWDPYWSAYTWLPGDGIFYSPFGFGFYSPGFAYAAPFYGYGFRGGSHNFGSGYRPGVVARPGGAGQVAAGGGVRGGGYNPGFGARANTGVRSGFSGGGVSGGGGFHGGGFGGGGFHGGGGGRR